MSRELKEREKMPAFKLSPETVANARVKFGPDSDEFVWLENVVLAKMPFALLGKLTQMDKNQIRDMLTGRRTYTDEGHQKMQQFNKLIDRGLNEGVFPCADLAVVEPVTMTLLRCMLLEKQNEMLKKEHPQQ